MLSSIDWALIESWKEMEIPLHIVLRGIEKAFDSWESKPRKRSVKTLLYCQEEVEAQYAEWLESRVGAEADDEAAGVGDESAEDDKKPFSRAAILAHLQSARVQIAAAETKVANSIIAEALNRAASQLRDLEDELTRAKEPDAKKLEVSLTGIERMLNETLVVAIPLEEQAVVTAEVRKNLKPYKSHMEASVYEQTVDNFVLKHFREQLGVPRLSLFFLGM
ncbi:MAG TPA: hypothetical protein VGN86_18675 [Pyrinomonadaceae bacterium]|nr:hypothetical protein [Pyrinomonadaceae bacterium]